MEMEISPNGSDKRLAQGRKYFLFTAVASMVIGVAVTIVELLSWNFPGFLIGEAILLPLLALIFLLLQKGHSLRWILFGLLLLTGAYTFLLAGLHMTDIEEAPIDPLCYWLAAAGLAYIAMGGYSAYSEEMDQYFKHLVQKR
jgi:NADH:ubiquinone oxidoreductase subunit 4 (subunit M)